MFRLAGAAMPSMAIIVLISMIVYYLEQVSIYKYIAFMILCLIGIYVESKRGHTGLLPGIIFLISLMLFLTAYLPFYFSSHSLKIHTTPEDATIMIRYKKGLSGLYTEKEFRQGMRLKEGKEYSITVKKDGFRTYTDWITLDKDREEQGLNLDISLERIDTPISKAASKPLPKPVSKPVPPKSKCDNGDSTACYKQGRDYYKGIGVEKNYQKAAHYFLKGCDLGNSASCLNIGVMYYQGQGVGEDTNKAVIFLNKACKLGNKDACDNLKALGNL